MDFTSVFAQEQLDQGSTLSFLFSIFEHSPNLFFVKDDNGRYVLVNKVFEQEFNLPNKSIIGKTDHELMSLEEAEQCVNSDLPARESKGKIHNSIELELNDDGEVACYIAVNKQVVDTVLGEFLIGIVTRIES